jgi:D-alanyl-D-alanine carboxypeptidase
MVGGAYAVDSDSLTIELEPSTMAACPPESLSDQYLAYLAGAAKYRLEEGQLHIDLMADGGTMSFDPATDTGDDGEGAMDGALPEDLVAQLDALLQSQVYSEGGYPEGAAPGLVLLVDTPDGRYLQAAGVSNIEEGTPMQVDDRLEIGSNSKSFTVALLMQLVEEGVLSLDDPLSKWLPEQAASLPNGDQMTVRQLAHHTTGAWDYGDAIIGAGTTDPAKLVEAYTPAEIVQYAVDNGTPDFAPGEEFAWKYSNTGYILLGMVIEAAAGEKLGDLYQSRIFDPLELESALFLEGVPEAGQITNGYWWEDGQRIDTTNWNVSQGWAAGGNAMTAADLAAYGKALAAGELFQNPDTLNEMIAFDENALMVAGTPYGLGLMDMSGDGAYWGHEGQTAGFQSLWYTNPDKEIVVVALTNSASYNAFSFLNVINILEGDGALPVGPVTLLPVGALAPTSWEWAQFVNPVDSTDIDESTGLELVIAKDQSVTINSSDCGSASGAYTVDGLNSIDFDIDDSGITCDADSLAGQFVGYLSDATSWHFDNGGLAVELPMDGGAMVFKPAPESEE